MNEENIKEKIYEGLIIKNYKILCKEYLDVKPTSGNGKIYHFKELSRFCEYHKEGQKIIIDKVFNKIKEKIDMRKSDYISETDKRHNGNNSIKYKKYEQLKINKDVYNNIGVYYITNGIDIYIGSTTKSFRERFKEHLYGSLEYMKHTHYLLHNGGKFNILYDMTNIQDIDLIRMIENEYIQYFKEYTDFNVINHINGANWKGKKTYKQKYKNIKIKKEDYEKALKLLEENGFEI